MREIKFRGKATNRSSDCEYRTSYKNGDWVYGLLEKHEFRLGDKSLPATMRNECGVSDIDVEEFTLGQFTGLRDKNGKEIYEGDIVEFEYKSTHSKGIAKIEYALYKWKYNGCYYNQNIAVWLDICDTDVIFEVIGNIYDNTELLRGEKD